MGEAAMDIHHNPDASGRYGNLVDRKGKKLPGAGVELKIVTGGDKLGPEKIDVSGSSDVDDVEDTPVEETLDTRSVFEGYLKNIFRKVDATVYRAGNINTAALGHRVSLEQGPKDYVYVVGRADGNAMREAFDHVVSQSSEEAGVQFSQKVIDNKLEQNDLGFTRVLELNGEIFKVSFLYGADGTTDTSQGVEDIDFGGLKDGSEDENN
ncbi:hypothetical protein C0581_01050 [Candidatus Parcubacteria bacterium]|nr:MAG: hypothetical protein C0581_01050 [Candidatus Parcubacteria bacterium]